MHLMHWVSRNRRLRGLPIVAALALTACATTPAPPPDYDALFATARDFAEAGRIDAALETYRRAAEADRSRKEPWQQMAVLNFAAARPVSALAAAEETLQRDPGDVAANRVFIASGIQIAQQAMQRLLAAGAKHDDDDLLHAQELVTLMGQVFGEDKLIPDQAKARYARRAVQQYRATQAKQSRVRVPEEKSKPRPNPFEVLGGD